MGINQVSVQILPDGRMNTHNAAKYLGMSEKTLAMWRCDGKGPDYTRVGGRIFYFQQALDKFIAGEEK